MTDRLNDMPPTVPSTALIASAYDRLGRLVDEHAEGGLVDQTRAKLNERHQDAVRSLNKIKQSLEGHKAEIQTIESSIEQIVNDFAAMLRAGKQPSSNIEVRTVIQTERRGQLEAEIARLNDQELALHEYIRKNRQDEHLLAVRAEAVALAIGSFATAYSQAESVVDVMPVPPLFGDVYRYQPVITDGYLSNFTLLPDEHKPRISDKESIIYEKKPTISVPLRVILPSKLEQSRDIKVEDKPSENKIIKAPMTIESNVFAPQPKRGRRR